MISTPRRRTGAAARAWHRLLASLRQEAIPHERHDRHADVILFPTRLIPWVQAELAALDRRPSAVAA